MKNKQTAIEWLIEHSHIIPRDIPKMELIEQAKQMEKEELKQVYWGGVIDLGNGDVDFEQYYRDRYGK